MGHPLGDLVWLLIVKHIQLKIKGLSINLGWPASSPLLPSSWFLISNAGVLVLWAPNCSIGWDSIGITKRYQAVPSGTKRVPRGIKWVPSGYQAVSSGYQVGTKRYQVGIMRYQAGTKWTCARSESLRLDWTGLD